MIRLNRGWSHVESPFLFLWALLISTLDFILENTTQPNLLILNILIIIIVMAPTIHLVRHAQGFHNLSIENESMQDPDLTPLGEEQCAALRKEFPHHDKLTKLFASPMRRTVYTCLHAFGTEDLKPIIAMPVFQEVSANPCDTGSAVAKVQAEFQGIADYSRVEDSWTDKGPGSEYEPTVEKLTARGLKARRALRDLVGGDEHIVVVSHGGFL